MKLISIVNARGALQKLICQDLPLKKAFQLVELVEKCNTYLTFFSQERQKLGAMPDEEKLSDLESFEVTDLSELPISIPAADDLRLSAADIKVLAPFVHFTFEGV